MMFQHSRALAPLLKAHTGKMICNWMSLKCDMLHFCEETEGGSQSDCENTENLQIKDTLHDCTIRQDKCWVLSSGLLCYECLSLCTFTDCMYRTKMDSCKVACLIFFFHSATTMCQVGGFKICFTNSVLSVINISSPSGNRMAAFRLSGFLLLQHSVHCLPHIVGCWAVMARP